MTSCHSYLTTLGGFFFTFATLINQASKLIRALNQSEVTLAQLSSRQAGVRRKRAQDFLPCRRMKRRATFFDLGTVSHRVV